MPIPLKVKKTIEEGNGQVETPEVVPEVAPEVKVEEEVKVEKVEKADEKLEEVPEIEKPAPSAPTTIPPAVSAPVKSEALIQIEKVLQEDLEDHFHQMDPKTQKKFKEEGEEVASKVEGMVSKTKIKVKKIFSLIRDWLKIIPGVNKFFLEQEAKIKTDKILDLAEEEKKKKV